MYFTGEIKEVETILDNKYKNKQVSFLMKHPIIHLLILIGNILFQPRI